MIKTKKQHTINPHTFDLHGFLPKNFKEVLKQMRSSSMEKRLKKFGMKID